MPKPRRAPKKRVKPYKPRARRPEASGLSTKAQEIIARTRAWRAARDAEVAGVDISALGPAVEFTGPKKQNVLSMYKFQGAYADKPDPDP
jgi:hypothetical protein